MKEKDYQSFLYPNRKFHNLWKEWAELAVKEMMWDQQQQDDLINSALDQLKDEEEAEYTAWLDYLESQLRNG